MLMFEVLYYSIFMKCARKEGKILKYLALFAFVNIFFLFVGTNSFVSYVILLFMILFGLKYFVKIKVNLCDMLTIILMLLFKILIEAIVCLLLYLILKDTVIPLVIANILKIAIIILFNKNINKIFSKIRDFWNKNNFYIRYIFSCLLYLYIIISVIFLIYK